MEEKQSADPKKNKGRGRRSGALKKRRGKQSGRRRARWSGWIRIEHDLAREEEEEEE